MDYGKKGVKTMSLNWNNVKPACCAKWLVLPTVYSDALSYGEQLDKFCYQLNQLIENNNILPDFIAEMIKEYINSGAIGEVVRDILADYILNVKYPPEGITPAVGDGSADDTAAIQGCIDYAAENGGVVYFPYGSYLTQPLTMKDEVSLFGFDRYSTKIVLKGGATKPLIGGTVADFSMANLTLDGNSGIQVNDVNVVTIMATNVLFTNLIIKDGYTLVNYVGTGGHFQISDVVFGNAVEKCLVTAGNADVQCENVVFNQLSAIGGISVIDIGTDGGYFNVKSLATCDMCIVVNSNDNNIVAIVKNATTPVTDNGLRNNIEIVGVSDKQYFSDDTTKEVNGSYSKHIGGTYTKVVDGNSSESYEGNYSKNVTGVASETYSDSKTVTGKKVVINATNYNVNASGDVSVSGDDIALKPTNPLTYRQVVNGTPFKYVEMKDTNGNPYKLLASTGDNFDILPILDVTKYGVLPNGSDISDKLNELITTYGDSYTIYMKKGTYTASKTIVIRNYQCKLVCDGVIKSSANIAINVLSNGVQLDITGLTGTGVAGSCGFLVGGELTTAIGNGNFHFQLIDNFDYGIILRGNHGYGVQNNNFYLNRIDHFKVGITIECGDGASWVNENRFYDCWCFGYEGNEGSEIGVKFNKGSEQTDPFNGNRFVNFSCEGCATMFNLSFAERNSFIDFRMIEQAGDNQIVCDNTSNNNLFTSVNAMADVGMFNDQSVNNIYKIRAYKDNTLVCDSFTFAFGVFMPLDSGLIFNNMNYAFNGNGGAIPGDSPLKYLTLVNGTQNKMTVVLPLCVNYPQTIGNGFSIETGNITGEIEVICYGGQVFISSNNETTTLTGFHLKPWSKYLVTCVGVMIWKIVEILPNPTVPTGVTVTTTASGTVTETQQAVAITANSVGTLTYS